MSAFGSTESRNRYLAARAGLAVMSVRRLTKQAQRTEHQRRLAYVFLASTVGVALFTKYAERGMLDLGRPVRPEEVPGWHTQEHAPLVVNERFAGATSNVVFVRTGDTYVAMVTPTFLTAPPQEQRDTFNDSISKTTTYSATPVAVALTGATFVATLTHRRLMIGDRETLSARRAAVMVSSLALQERVLIAARDRLLRSLQTPLKRA